MTRLNEYLSPPRLSLCRMLLLLLLLVVAAPALRVDLQGCLVRVLDCLYETGLDTCSLVLDGAGPGPDSAALLRQALAVIPPRPPLLCPPATRSL